MDTNRAIYGTIPRNPNPKSHPIHDTTVDRLDTWLLERIESRVHLSNSTPTRFFSPFESFSKLSQLSRSTSSSSSSTRIDPGDTSMRRRVGEQHRIFDETSSFYFRSARRLYSVSCAEFNRHDRSLERETQSRVKKMEITRVVTFVSLHRSAKPS